MRFYTVLTAVAAAFAGPAFGGNRGLAMESSSNDGAVIAVVLLGAIVYLALKAENRKQIKARLSSKGADATKTPKPGDR